VNVSSSLWVASMSMMFVSVMVALLIGMVRGDGVGGDGANGRWCPVEK